MMQFSNNFKEVADKLRTKRFETQRAIADAWDVSGWAFVSKITTEQMTGRPGLNTQTGTLKKAWWSKTTLSKDGTDVVLRVGVAKRAWYAIVHQTGKVIKAKGDGWLRFRIHTATQVFSKRGGAALKRQKKLYSWITVKQVTIPKRLFIPETWKSFTHPMLMTKTLAIFHRLAKGS